MHSQLRFWSVQSCRPLARMLFLLAPPTFFLLIVLLPTFVQAQTPAGEPAGESVDIPVYVPFVQTGADAVITPSISGALLLADLPFANATVAVRSCGAHESGASRVYTATSDSAGQYSIALDASEAQTGEALSLTLSFSTTSPITLSTTPTESIAAFGMFTSTCIPAGVYPQLTLPTFDLQAPVFLTPTEETLVDMPILFTWQHRDFPAAEETQQWRGLAHFDCLGCAPMQVEASVQISTATALEWCAISAYASAITDVTTIDYTLRVSNTLGVGETLPRRNLVGATTQLCPPLAGEE